MTSTQGHSNAASQQAAARTRQFLNSPIRLGIPTILIGVFLSLLILARGDVIPDPWGWPLVFVLLALFIALAIFSSGAPHPGKRLAALSEPFIADPNIASWSKTAPAFMVPAVVIAGSAAAELIPSTNTVLAAAITIIGAAVLSALIVFPRKIGIYPIAFPLPEDFDTRYRYSADSPEAAVLAVLITGGAPRRVAFSDCLPYFTSLDDATLNAALQQLREDGVIKIAPNSTALTQKGRNRQLVMLTDAA